MGQTSNTAIIVAAGSGQRFGTETPKQFLKLSDQEVLAYSVNSFLDHPDIQHVIIVTSQDYLDTVTVGYPRCTVVLGGETRQDSVGQGLKACPAVTAKVLIHDAARPLIPDSVIDNCLETLETHEGVAPAVEPTDSMVLLQGSNFQNLSRADLRIVQTPQCFRFQTLMDAHASGKIDTDEIGLVRQALPEAKITLIKGSEVTLKITTAADLDRAAFFLRRTAQSAQINT